MKDRGESVSELMIGEKITITRNCTQYCLTGVCLPFVHVFYFVSCVLLLVLSCLCVIVVGWPCVLLLVVLCVLFLVLSCLMFIVVGWPCVLLLVVLCVLL